MSEVNSTQMVNSPVPPGYVTVQDVGTVDTGNPSGTASVRIGGGYFVMPSLISLGLPGPTGPKDLHAYSTALWIEVESMLDDVAKQERIAGNEVLQTMLSRYGWLFTAESEYGAMIAEREARIGTHEAQLSTLRSERNDLLDQREELVGEIAEETSGTRRAELEAELDLLDIQLAGLNENIESLEGDVAVLLAEVEDLSDSLSQIDVAFIILLTAIVRERTPVDNEMQSTESIQVERNEEKISQFRERAVEINLAQYRGDERISALKELEVQLQTNKELLMNLKLTAMSLIHEKLQPEPNGGILHQLPKYDSGNGARFHLSL